MELLFNIIIRVATALAIMAGALLLNAFKNSKNAHVQKIALQISETIEQVYAGCTSAEKLEAFKELCAAKKINVKKAVKFLESYLIPASKALNSDFDGVIIAGKKADDDTEEEEVV